MIQFTKPGSIANAVLTETVSTYSEMLAKANGNIKKRFLVINDEKQGLDNTLYDYWPGIGLFWVASVQDN